MRGSVLHVAKGVSSRGRLTAFVLETTASGRLHVHGVVAAISDAPHALRDALTQAGGLWDGAGAEYQLDLQPVWDDDGWSHYCVKDAARTRRALGVKHVLSLSRDLTRMARDYWEGLRACQRARRSAARGNSIRCSLASIPVFVPVSASPAVASEELVSVRLPDSEVSTPTETVNLATTGPSRHLEHEMAMQVSVNRPVHRRERIRQSSDRPHSARLSRRADEGASLAGVNSSGGRLHIQSYGFTSPGQRSSPRSQAGDDSYSGSSARHGSPANVGLARDAHAVAQVPHRSRGVMSGDAARVVHLDSGHVPPEGCVERSSRGRGPQGRGRKDGSAISSPVDLRPTVHATREIRRRPSILRRSTAHRICRQPLIGWPDRTIGRQSSSGDTRSLGLPCSSSSTIERRP